MRRWETLAALLAVVLASLSVVSVGGHPRPILAIVAILLIGYIALARLRAAVTTRKKRSAVPDAYERALRIQEARERRFRR